MIIVSMSMVQVTTVPLETQLHCARRELRLRRSTYAKWVQDGRMLAKTADKEIAAMAAIAQTLTALLEARQMELFVGK
jgi:hypothetical protein